MTDELEIVRRRMVAGRRRAAEQERRQDYKGPRGRLNLRVREGLLFDLALIKLAGGGDKNSVCEGLLLEGVAEQLERLRAGFDAAAWAVLRERAAAERGGGDGD